MCGAACTLLPLYYLAIFGCTYRYTWYAAGLFTSLQQTVVLSQEDFPALKVELGDLYRERILRHTYAYKPNCVGWTEVAWTPPGRTSRQYQHDMPVRRTTPQILVASRGQHRIICPSSIEEISLLLLIVVVVV